MVISGAKRREFNHLYGGVVERKHLYLPGRAAKVDLLKNNFAGARTTARYLAPYYNKYFSSLPRRITIKSRLFAQRPTNKLIIAKRPRHFNLLILGLRFAGSRGENTKKHKSATII
jgi:hypothetical protein